MKFFLKAEAAQQRYSICESCDQLSSLKICQQCNCFMPLKTRLPWVDCPKGLWKESTDFNEADPIHEPVLPEQTQSKEEIIIVP